MPRGAKPGLRAEAKTQGLLYYFTGKPCKQGHLSKRFVTGQCVECNRMHGATDQGKASKKRSAAQPANLEKHRQWVRSNPKKTHAYEKKWRDANREKYVARIKQWAKAHPEYVAAKTARRRMRMKGSENYTAQDILDILRDQKSKCAYCKESLKNGYHVDHIKPLSPRRGGGGTNDRRNIQLLCEPCNLAKSDTDPIEFAQKLGWLI